MSSLLRIAIVLTASIAAGAAQQAITGHPWVADAKEVSKKQDLKDEITKRRDELRARAGIALDQFKTLIEQGALIIDARTAEEFEKEHLTIESPVPVINVHPDHLQDSIGRLAPFQSQTIVIYCTSETCDLGEQLYMHLEKQGFIDMKLFVPGWEGLKQAGMPAATGPDTWTGVDFGAPPTAAESASETVVPETPDDAQMPADPAAEQP